MQKKILATVTCFGINFGLSFNAIAQENALKAFAPAQAGQSRWVIQLPKKRDESLLKVELLAGKYMQVDCNQHALQGAITTHQVQGWGYSYYHLNTEDGTIATRMHCPDIKRQVFVHVPSYTVYYNSKLPLVVYTPQGYQVRYRIWKAKKHLHQAVQK